MAGLGGAIFDWILESLFPVPGAEREALSVRPEEALFRFPPAPSYAGLAASLPECRSLFAYKDERVWRLIWALKYKKSGGSARIAGYALWHELISREVAMSPPSIVVIPMPITGRRRRERGFNQCELMVSEMDRLERVWSAGAGTAPRFTAENKLLERVIHASRQTVKGRSERLSGAKGAFAANQKTVRRLVIGGADRAPRHRPGTAACISDRVKIIVIDDVITTGSTMREALDTLKANGFDNVSGLSLAH